MDDALLLPQGTRLLHIGPQKTGTTYLQAAVHAAREDLERQGVHYASPNRQAKRAALAAVGRTAPLTGERVPRSHWTKVVRDIERSTAKRVVLSAEAFADADRGSIERIARELDPTRIHIVTTLRPLARILPSQWQQYVQAGMPLSYDAWLRSIFDADRHATPSFWRRHRHHELIARWADVVGWDRVTVVIVDDADFGAILRTFERLLGLRTGTLQPVEALSNRSLTRAEIELVRAMHRLLAAAGASRPLRMRLVIQGAAPSMEARQPAPDEPRIETPEWARERLVAVTTEIVDGIRANRVRVVGDLEALRGGSRPVRGGNDAAAQAAWPAVTSTGLMGVLAQAALTRGRAAPTQARDLRWADDPGTVTVRATALDLVAWSTPRLMSLLVGRIKDWLPAPLRGPARGVRWPLRRGRRRRRR